MRRRNRFRLPAGLLAVAVLAAAASACGSSSSAKGGGGTTSSAGSAGTTSGSGTPGPATPTGKPLVIGASLSLTGDFADPGKAVQKGYELWADMVNKKGGLLGRPVSIKVVDDASNPDQAVTNYQNLINRDHVDLVFGPFSSLLTIPASAVAKRYGYAFLEPAGGGPKVFDQKLDNLFFIQPATVVKSGDVFADWILSLPADQRPKTAAYAELDDPFAQPIAEEIRTRFEGAGIKTVYQQVYPAETTDLGPVMSKVAAANPDVVVSGTQSDDAYAQVKAMIQLKFSPKFLFMSNGANSPVDFPDKVGAGNVNGVFSAGDWYAATNAPGSADFANGYIAKYGGKVDDIDNSSAEAYATGQVLEDVAQKAGKIDNATIISTLHGGSWPTILGNLSWDSIGQPQGSFSLIEWINGKLTPVYPADREQAAPVFPKPNWGG